MLVRSHPYVTTILIMAFFVVLGQVGMGGATNLSVLLIIFLSELGLFLILIHVSLGGSSEARKRLGWIKPKLSDLPQLLLLVASTLLLVNLFTDSNTKLNLSGVADTTLFILCLLLASITEEVFFRSWMLSTLMASGVPRVLVVAISVIAFGLIHLWQGFHGVVVAAFVGLVYALFFLYRRSLFILIGAHAIHNIVVFLYHIP
ncbi:hypothetical protein S1OALGB6SA_1874 [Olavius algarvensis spirochete endosymbiont]|nr:MAG: hypothetical protein [Olavius algarvensis spirochete endosymbiont]VDB00784.1 hypothetical protein S1OALGB6SA_1874 [Olavius algarvensis spirochete endosymbiont]